MVWNKQVRPKSRGLQEVLAQRAKNGRKDDDRKQAQDFDEGGLATFPVKSSQDGVTESQREWKVEQDSTGESRVEESKEDKNGIHQNGLVEERQSDIGEKDVDRLAVYVRGRFDRERLGGLEHKMHSSGQMESYDSGHADSRNGEHDGNQEGGHGLVAAAGISVGNVDGVLSGVVVGREEEQLFDERKRMMGIARTGIDKSGFSYVEIRGIRLETATGELSGLIAFKEPAKVYEGDTVSFEGVKLEITKLHDQSFEVNGEPV